ASALEAALADAKKALEEGTAEAMNNTFNNLQTASHKLAEALYQTQSTTSASEGEQASAAGASSGGGTQAGGEDNVIDAEYVDVNPGDKASEERFKLITEAHDILSDPKKRAVYDRFGQYSDNLADAAARGASGARAGAGGARSAPFDFTGFDWGNTTTGSAAS